MDPFALAAAAGGFCAILAQPNTDPVVDSAPVLRSLRERARAEARIPTGFLAAITVGQEGERLTEMAVYIGVRETERLKAQKYMGLPATLPSPFYFDRYGMPAPGNQPVAQGYKVKLLITNLVDRNSKLDVEDLRELTVEVWDNGETRPYIQMKTLLSFGGI